MLIMHLFSTIQTKVYANYDRKCDIESICCTKARSGGMKIYQKDFLKSSENQAVYMY